MCGTIQFGDTDVIHFMLFVELCGCEEKGIGLGNSIKYSFPQWMKLVTDVCTFLL
jgi:hypothetical protein